MYILNLFSCSCVTCCMVGCPSLSMLDFLFGTLVLGQKTRKRTDMNHRVIANALFGIFLFSFIPRPRCPFSIGFFQEKAKKRTPSTHSRVHFHIIGITVIDQDFDLASLAVSEWPHLASWLQQVWRTFCPNVG